MGVWFLGLRPPIRPSRVIKDGGYRPPLPPRTPRPKPPKLYPELHGSGGYQPNGVSLDRANPPQGGSGVSNEIFITINIVVEEK